MNDVMLILNVRYLLFICDTGMIKKNYVVDDNCCDFDDIIS